MIRAEVSFDKTDLWENIETDVENIVANELENADYVDSDGVVSLIHEELSSNDVASSADVYDILEDYDFSAQFDYYMESYPWSEEMTKAMQGTIDELRAQVDMLMDERAARIDARLSNRLRRLWTRLKDIHWYSPFMPRR